VDREPPAYGMGVEGAQVADSDLADVWARSSTVWLIFRSSRTSERGSSSLVAGAGREHCPDCHPNEFVKEQLETRLRALVTRPSPRSSAATSSSRSRWTRPANPQAPMTGPVRTCPPTRRTARPGTARVADSEADHGSRLAAQDPASPRPPCWRRRGPRACRLGPSWCHAVGSSSRLAVPAQLQIHLRDLRHRIE